MAFVLFIMLKFVNGLLALGKKKEEEKEEAKKSAELEVLEQILAEVKKK